MYAAGAAGILTCRTVYEPTRETRGTHGIPGTMGTQGPSHGIPRWASGDPWGHGPRPLGTHGPGDPLAKDPGLRGPGALGTWGLRGPGPPWRP